MDAGRHDRASKKAQEAEAARDELREALAGVDVVLPSLGVDLVSLTSAYLSPLVELGSCRADVASKLAAAPEEVRPVSEESAPEPEEETDSPEETSAGVAGHEALLAKVREANKRSLAPRR